MSDIHDTARRKAAATRAASQEPSVDQIALSRARPLIAEINSLLPDITRRLIDARVPFSARVEEVRYHHGWFRSKTTRRLISDGWAICQIIHNSAGQPSGMNPGSDYSFACALVLLPDGQVAETMGPTGYQNFNGFYATQGNDLPPSFIFPRVHRPIEYAFELQQGSPRSPGQFALRFAELYKEKVTDFLARTLY